MTSAIPTTVTSMMSGFGNEARPCRFCGTPLTRTFVDLGMSPLCQTQISPAQLNFAENFYPLHVRICESCFLVQLDEYVRPEVIFGSNYPYFSSYAKSWVEHARRYAEKMQREFGINQSSFVVELASNDGYLLQHFKAAGVPCLGVEPTAGTAAVAIQKGIPTEVAFFGEDLASHLRTRHGAADLVLGNNVLAHVPDLNGFVAGVARLLASTGFATFEFPHVMRLMEFNQFDTIYHEHFSYFSFTTACRVFEAHGLTVFEVEELPTHGGSLRVYVQQSRSASRPVATSVGRLLAREAAAGVMDIAPYEAFARRVRATKRRLLHFLIEAKDSGMRVVGYGAPGKGVTLLNYCGIGTDFLDFTVDRNPSKQGTYMPGARIPILAPEAIIGARPDYILILPWNLRDEIVQEMSEVRSWGGRFVIPIPSVEVL